MPIIADRQPINDPEVNNPAKPGMRVVALGFTFDNILKAISMTEIPKRLFNVC